MQKKYILDEYGNSLCFDTVLFRDDIIQRADLNSYINGVLYNTAVSDQGRGSFSRIFIHEGFCVRFTPLIGNGLAFLERIERSYSRLMTSNPSACVTYALGRVYNETLGIVLGEMIIMERLIPLSPAVEEPDIYTQIESISKIGFHNDFTLSNIMQRESDGKVCAIDFDLLEDTKVVVAVSSHSFLEVNFAPLALSTNDMQSLRILFDYSQLSLCVSGSHPIYKPILHRLTSIFKLLHSSGSLVRVVNFCMDQNVLHQVPIEIIVKHPDLDATTVNVFDLRGNAFAHGLKDWESGYPSFAKSNGVYWPPEAPIDRHADKN